MKNGGKKERDTECNDDSLKRCSSYFYEQVAN
jgi:hypothetical protein